MDVVNGDIANDNLGRHLRWWRPWMWEMQEDAWHGAPIVFSTSDLVVFSVAAASFCGYCGY